jgi:ABC transporter substrate binding protein
VSDMHEFQMAARASGLDATTFEIRRTEDITAAFAAFKGKVDALYVAPDALLNTNRMRINTLALAARLPTMYGARENVEAAGLISYGPSFTDLFRRAGDYVDKILRGTRPADLPGGAADQVRAGCQSNHGDGARPRRATDACYSFSFRAPSRSRPIRSMRPAAFITQSRLIGGISWLLPR